MKTTAPTKRHDSDKSAALVKEDKTNTPEEEVAVIVDTQTGAEYYMFPIDFFKIEKRSYAVMVPYEPYSVHAKDAEVVILRSQIAKNGDQLYISIRNKKELESAFDVFFKRFEESSES